jgi:branched-chain amino acid transport system substrate-binding protein
MDRAVAALELAESLFEAGDYAEAARQTDSLYRAWRGERGVDGLANRTLWLQGRSREALGEMSAARDAYQTLVERSDGAGYGRGAVGRLAALRAATGDPDEALAVLLDYPEAVGEAELETAREIVGELTPGEVQRQAERYDVDSGPAAVVLHAEWARVLVLSDRADSAKRVARRVLDARPADYERELAGLILEAGDAVVGGALRVGVVLPLSGRFSAVGQLLKEGIEIAREAHLRAGGGEVQFDFRDDGSDAERAVALAGELESEGVLAIIGLVRSESFASAGRGRKNRRLLLISPTATEVVEPIPNSYTMWDRQRRQLDVAEDMAAWLVRDLGVRSGAVLYPDDAAGRAIAGAFRDVVERSGGAVVAAVPYAPDSTTFDAPIAALAQARPDVVYVAGASVPTLLQLAPQLYYYGVDRSLIAGGPTWTEPSVLRQLDAAAANYRIAGGYADRVGAGTRWAAFRAEYERKYRKSLGDNIFPALSHDAALLVLTALMDVGLPLPGAVSQRVGGIRDLEGATGVLSPEPSSSTVGRRTLVRMVLDGELVRAEPARLLTWLDQARARADSIARARADSIARVRRGDGTPGDHRSARRDRP